VVVRQRERVNRSRTYPRDEAARRSGDGPINRTNPSRGCRTSKERGISGREAAGCGLRVAMHGDWQREPSGFGFFFEGQAPPAEKSRDDDWGVPNDGFFRVKLCAVDGKEKDEV